MKVQRLVVESGGGAALTLGLHPRLTVVGGLSAPQSTALADVLGRALRAGTPGIHVDFLLDDGTELRAVHPACGDARILDRITGADVTPRWRTDEGRLDLGCIGGRSDAIGRPLRHEELGSPTSTSTGAHVDFLAAAQCLYHLSHETLTVDLETAAIRATALLAGLATARGTGAEPMPAIVGDVFSDLDRAVEPMLLDVLATASSYGQVIVLAQRESLTSWARLEQLTGNVAVIEPALAGIS